MIALSGVRSSCDMLARNSDLCLLAISSCAALVLDLVEQPHVLDGDHGLVGEGLAAARSACRENGPTSSRPHGDRADRPAFPQHRHAMSIV